MVYLHNTPKGWMKDANRFLREVDDDYYDLEELIEWAWELIDDADPDQLPEDDEDREEYEELLDEVLTERSRLEG